MFRGILFQVHKPFFCHVLAIYQSYCGIVVPQTHTGPSLHVLAMSLWRYGSISISQLHIPFCTLPVVFEPWIYVSFEQWNLTCEIWPLWYAKYSRKIFRIFSTLSQAIFVCLVYGQLSPCGHLAITDTPLIRTKAKCPAKINYRRLTEMNSRNYGLSLVFDLLGSVYQYCVT